MKTSNLKLTAGITRTASLLLVMFMMVQCVGPRGPRGNDGVDGIDGIDGIHYTHTAIYDVNSGEWDGDIDGYNVWLEVPEITEDIYYNGAVLVYRLIEIDPISFNMLPYTYVDNGFMIYLDYDAYIGGIDLIYKEILDGVNDTFAPENAMAFKIVIIEGLPLATVKEMVDIRDLNAVVKTFKIDLNKEGYQPF
jgi:hypothetical protein